MAPGLWIVLEDQEAPGTRLKRHPRTAYAGLQQPPDRRPSQVENLMNAIRYTIDHQRRLVHARTPPTVTLREILEYESRIVEDPAFDPTYSELFDTTGTTTMTVSFEDVDNLVEFERSHGRYIGKRRCAFVAPTDINYGTVKMYISMEDTSPMETQVFRDRPAALEWLGLSDLPSD